ncbi:speriolin [Hippopotamus amphibius kiboko]|uniref:speriolin n=1 Tax=Hippopotamus amphibius kiboko TaxID=575201 RepID=UPI002599E524|nr:speriolin [Hippopotamus amphibius kiboko]
MSLLTSYEGLRHQIERLVRENEELKKLVRLIRENQELKSAIKMQAGGLGISEFSEALPPWGEPGVSVASLCPPGVFLPPSPAAAHEPVLEEAGMVALAPLADTLSGPTAAAGPVVSPLTGPLTTLLPSPGPVAPGSALTSLLTGPVAVPPAGTPASSPGLPSTGPLNPSSQLDSPVAVSPAGTPASSLGLPSTGSLPPSSPLEAPAAGSVAPSLSRPPLTPTAAPPGVAQNLPATPTSNLVLSEAPRVRLAEPLRGCPSGPHPSAGGGPAAPSKVPLSTEHLLPTQEPEPFSMTFVGAPIQTSTPVGTTGTPGPVTASSCGTSDARTQPGGPQGRGVLASVPVSSASPNISVLASVPTPAPQAATNDTPAGTPQPSARTHPSPTRPSPTPHSPPRNPHSPPRTSSSPASVNDTQGPRIPEPPRKSVPELERTLTHRKSSKFPGSSRGSKQLACERLVGEIAFQLDRRILSSIFPERVRLYGFTVSNIPEKIIQASLNPSDHRLDEELCQTLTQRYVSVMNRLQSLGYDGRVHPALTEQLVNAYGILRERPEPAASQGGSYTVDFLQRVLVQTVHPSLLADALLLLSCLSQLAHDDGKPVFIW